MSVATLTAADTPPVAEVAGPAPSRATGVGRALLAGAALVVGSLAIRLTGFDAAYWIDEALSVGIAHQPLHEIPGLLARDGSPPLWYLLLGVWIRVFGDGETATHALALLPALGAIPVAWWAGRRIGDVRTAWIAAALAAINPFVSYFGRETRMYSLVALLSIVVAATFVLGFVRGEVRHRWWFAAALVALLYTHNWGLYLAVAAAVAVGLLAVLRRSPDVLRAAVVPFAVAGAAYLPWLPTLLAQVQNTGAPWSYTPDARDLVRELAALWRDERVLAALGVVTTGGLLPVLRRWRTKDAAGVVVLVVLTVVPILLGWAVAHAQPSWATRYLAVIVGPLLLVVALGLASSRAVGIVALVAAAVLVIQPVTRIGGDLDVRDDAKSNAREIAGSLGGRLRPGDAVVATQPEAVPLLRHYLGDDVTYADPAGVLDEPLLMDWRDAEERLEASTVADGLRPIVDAMDVGDRLLLVVPSTRGTRATDTSWITLHRRLGDRWFAALRAEDDMVVVGRTRGPKRSYVSLDAVLFERT